eukprot:UN14963
MDEEMTTSEDQIPEEKSDMDDLIDCFKPSTSNITIRIQAKIMCTRPEIP